MSPEFYKCSIQSDKNKCDWEKVTPPVAFTNVYQGYYDLWGITNYDYNHTTKSLNTRQQIYRCPDNCDKDSNWKEFTSSKSFNKLYIDKDYIYGSNYELIDNKWKNNYYKCSNTKDKSCANNWSDITDSQDTTDQSAITKLKENSTYTINA